MCLIRIIWLGPATDVIQSTEPLGINTKQGTVGIPFRLPASPFIQSIEVCPNGREVLILFGCQVVEQRADRCIKYPINSALCIWW